MITRKLGKTEMAISPVTYGGIVSSQDGQDASDVYVAWAVEHGINYFDVAPSYGDAQEKLGGSLVPYRKSIYLACKTQKRMRDEAEQEFNESLRMLHTDYLDNYQLHALGGLADVETAFGPGGVMELMVRLKEKGLTRNLGITCHSEEAALRALELYPFDTVLFPLNWHMNLGHGFGSRIAAAAKERGIGLLGMKAFIERAWKDDGEKKSSPFPKSWCKPIDRDNTALRVAAMKYALSLGAATLVPPGNFADFAFAVGHIDECLQNPLSDTDLALLRAAYGNVSAYPFFQAG